jgi:transcriptional regulator with XRE-family HTH domain
VLICPDSSQVIDMTRVRDLRVRLGWSEAKLAKESGVTVASIFLIERLGTAGLTDDLRVLEALERNLAAQSSFVFKECATTVN